MSDEDVRAATSEDGTAPPGESSHPSGPLPTVAASGLGPSTGTIVIEQAARRMADAPEATARLVLRLLLGLGAAVIVLGTVIVALALRSGPATPSFIVINGTARVGTVQNAGPGGVSLRARPSVAGDALSTVPDGGSLRIVCAQSGQVVTEVQRNVALSSPVWFRTVDGSFASSLYVGLGDPPTLANCLPGEPDLTWEPMRTPN